MARWRVFQSTGGRGVIGAQEFNIGIHFPLTIGGNRPGDRQGSRLQEWFYCRGRRLLCRLRCLFLRRFPIVKTHLLKIVGAVVFLRCLAIFSCALSVLTF